MNISKEDRENLLALKLYLWAETEVLKTRGSYDAPGFDACVEAEYKSLLKKEGLK